MSDFNSSLPVRTENNGDVAAKIVDGAIPSQALAVDAAGKITVKLDDGAGNDITSQANGAQQALDVGINVAGVQIDPRQVRALTNADVVTAEQGTSPWVTQDNSDGSVAPGAAAAVASLGAAQYNATPPTLADTQQAALQASASGRLLVDADVTLSEDHNYGAVGASTLRTAAQIGNATGAADFNAGATGAQTLRVESNQGAPAAVADAWPTLITDGTNTAAVSAGGELSVLATAQPGVDIGDVTVNNGAGAAAVNIQDGGNSITVDGTVAVSNLPATVDTDYGVVGASTIRTASQIGNASGAADFNVGAIGAQTLRVAAEVANASGLADFDNGATGAQTLRVAANLAVAGADVSSSNPVPVVVTDATPGTPINDFKHAVAVAGGASDNHDYTVTAAKTLYLNQIEASASGKLKIEVQVETGVASGVFNSRWVQFNSTATPNAMIHIDNPIAVAAGVRVRVIVTNRDNQSEDVYSTISGYELP